MHVEARRFELRLAGARSLKEKRSRIRPILDGARERYRVAAAEVAYQNQWQRAALGFAAVSASTSHLAEVLDEVERFVWSHPDIEVTRTTRDFLEVDADG
ncbi:MAG: DUF503 domain-containing protein [Acidimicrobiales bacterium]